MSRNLQSALNPRTADSAKSLAQFKYPGSEPTVGRISIVTPMPVESPTKWLGGKGKIPSDERLSPNCLREPTWHNRNEIGALERMRDDQPMRDVKRDIPLQVLTPQHIVD